MKKTVFIILTAILSGLLISCTEQSNLFSQTDIPKEDLFLISISENGSTISDQSSEFKSAASYGISTAFQTIEEKSLLESVKDPFNDGSTYTYRDSTRYLKAEKEGEFGTFYSQFDHYYGNNADLKYLAGTDTIVYYYKYSNPPTQSKQLDEKELISQAKDFLKQCIPEKSLANYEYGGMEHGALNMTLISFRRVVEGYSTDDVLTIFFDEAGEIIGYNGYSACKYDAISVKLTKDKLDSATEKLTQKIDALELNILTRSDPVLTTNTSGDVFIEIRIRYEIVTGNEGLPITDTATDSLYIRVN